MITKEENELGDLQPLLKSDLLETFNQRLNEKVISKLMLAVGDKICLCDYKQSLFEVINSKTNSPWMWNSTLSIGSKISINVSGFISSKSEFKLELKTQSTVPDMQVINSTKYFKNIEEIFPVSEDLIKGYMLGSTPIPFDEDLEIKQAKSKKGLQCLFFTKETSLSKNYFSGNGTYSVLPKKMSTQSTAVFNSLVFYLNQSNIVMVAKKVFRDNTNPKLVALLPRIINNVPQFVMIELFFSNQLLDMHFPKLTSKAFESNELELKSVENFIKSKSLDEFDLKNIPNSSLNFTINYLSNRLNGFAVLDENCFSDKTSSSTELINQMKEHFILETRKTPANKKKEEEPVQQEDNQNNNTVVDYGGIKQIGTVTPSDDFLFLVARDVSQINDTALRNQKFDQYAEQLQSVIERLLFKSITIQTEKITLALETYRNEAELYSAEGFNLWMLNLKTQIQSRKMNAFWENVIVQKSIGLISKGSEQQSFFIINKETVEAIDENTNNDDLDDMFDNM